jgi:hypothetical protein
VLLLLGLFTCAGYDTNSHGFRNSLLERNSVPMPDQTNDYKWMLNCTTTSRLTIKLKLLVKCSHLSSRRQNATRDSCSSSSHQPLLRSARVPVVSNRR